MSEFKTVTPEEMKEVGDFFLAGTIGIPKGIPDRDEVVRKYAISSAAIAYCRYVMEQHPEFQSQFDKAIDMTVNKSNGGDARAPSDN